MAHAASVPARTGLFEQERLRGIAVRVGLFLAVLVFLWGLWEAFRWLAESTGLRIGQFEANDRTMPHIHDIVGQLFEPLATQRAAADRHPLGRRPLHGEGGRGGIRPRRSRSDSSSARCSRTRDCSSGASCRTSSPRRRSRSSPSRRWSSCWVNPRLPDGLKDWGAVAVIAAYLTFFPVAINTLRGLTSVDPRALELMRSYAAGELEHPLEAPRPGRAAVHLHRAQDRRPRERRRRDHRGAAGVHPGRARRGDPQLQPVLRHLADEPVGDEPDCRAPRDRVLPRRPPRRAARRPPGAGALRMTSEPVVSLRDVTKTFAGGGVTALQSIDLDVRPGSSSRSSARPGAGSRRSCGSSAISCSRRRATSS